MAPGIRIHHAEGKNQNMTKHDAARRAFLVERRLAPGAVAGVLGSYPTRTPSWNGISKRMLPAPPATSQRRGAWSVFNHDHAANDCSGSTERLMPGAPDKPGASDAGVLNYIDLALSAPTPIFRISTGAGLASTRRALSQDL